MKRWIENPAHPIWPLLRLIVVMIPLCLFLNYGYNNGWSADDWKTLIVPLLSLFGFDVAKKYLTAKTDGKSGDET